MVRRRRIQPPSTSAARAGAADFVADTDPLLTRLMYVSDYPVGLRVYEYNQ